MPAPRPLGNDFRVNNTLFAGTQHNASVAGLTSGGFVVAWQSQNGDGAGFGIRAQVYDSLGNAFGGEISVNTTVANDQTSASVVATPGGGFFISWVDPGPSGVDDEIRGQAFDSSANKLGGEIHINTTLTNDQWLPDSAALANGNLVVVWTDNAGTSANIRAQILNGAGQAAGGELLVTGAANFQGHPAVAGLAGGGYVVIWTDSSLTDPVRVASGARGQIFDNSGNPGASFVVTTLISGITEDSSDNPVAVASLTGGGYVVAWKQLEQSPSNFFDIHAKVYNSSGTLVHDDFLVNTTTADSQHQPAVSRLADGGFIITWSDNTVHDEVKGQRFDASGNPNGAEFSVNSTASGSQSTSDIALLADGRFAVTFSSDDTGNSDIRARLFDPHESVVKDFNGDTKSDILWRSDAGNVVTWDMNDSHVLSTNALGSSPANWKIAGTGDFNGDHNADILWRSDAGTIVSWDMNDSHVLSTNVISSAPANWKIAGTGDFNGDGKSDILLRSDAGTIVSWDMNDGHVLSTNTLGSAPTDWNIAGTGDFNGDGKTDLLWRSDAGTIVTWDMNDGQVLSTNNLGSSPANWKIASTGDFNGDGKSDILWRSDAGTIVTWDMDDNHVRSTNVISSSPANWNIAGTGDFNGDGKSDILLRSDAGTIVSWDMNDSHVLSSNVLGSAPSDWHII